LVLVGVANNLRCLVDLWWADSVWASRSKTCRTTMLELILSSN